MRPSAARVERLNAWAASRRDFDHLHRLRARTRPLGSDPGAPDRGEVLPRARPRRMAGVTAPARIQLRRTKGWKMPPNTVKVDRSTPYGNPFRAGHEGPLGRTPIDDEGAVGFFRAMLADPELRAAANYPVDLSPLRGKNLACWCGGPFCHVDPLLEEANR